MATIQNYINAEEAEEQAKDNKRVDLRYIGPRTFLKDKKGKGYYIVKEDQWYFQPNDSDETYRVNINNLDFER